MVWVVGWEWRFSVMSFHTGTLLQFSFTSVYLLCIKKYLQQSRIYCNYSRYPIGLIFLATQSCQINSVKVYGAVNRFPWLLPRYYSNTNITVMIKKETEGTRVFRSSLHSPPADRFWYSWQWSFSFYSWGISVTYISHSNQPWCEPHCPQFVSCLSTLLLWLGSLIPATYNLPADTREKTYILISKPSSKFTAMLVHASNCKSDVWIISCCELLWKRWSCVTQWEWRDDQNIWNSVKWRHVQKQTFFTGMYLEDYRAQNWDSVGRANV
jgi:hypothetical protein